MAIKKKNSSWRVAAMRYVMKFLILSKMQRAIRIPWTIVESPGSVSTISAAARAASVEPYNGRYDEQRRKENKINEGRLVRYNAYFIYFQWHMACNDAYLQHRYTNEKKEITVKRISIELSFIPRYRG